MNPIIGSGLMCKMRIDGEDYVRLNWREWNDPENRDDTTVLTSWFYGDGFDDMRPVVDDDEYNILERIYKDDTIELHSPEE